jgi:hypothetical protein
VLLMQDGVRKLFLETVFVKELLDPAGYNGLLQDLVDIGPPVNIHG